MQRIISFIFLIEFVIYTDAVSQINLTADSETATNISGSGIDVSINTFIDNRDNQQYKYINIGGKKWMAENLNFRTPKSLTYNNKENYGEVFGRLYDWKEANCACPDQWRLPTEDEWKALEASIGLNSNVIDSIGWRGGPYGNLLKNQNSKNWLSNILLNKPNLGFDADAGGIAYNSNYFAYKGLGGYFWTATNYYSSFAWSRYLRYDRGEIFRNISAVNWYLSVRCVKD